MLWKAILSIILKIYLLLCDRCIVRTRDRERGIFQPVVHSSMATAPGAEPIQSKSQEFLSLFPMWVKEPQGLEPSSTAFPGRKPRAGLEVK